MSVRVVMDFKHVESIISCFDYQRVLSVHAARCVTHDETGIFYADDNHLSTAGARLLVDEIMRQVERQWSG